MNTQLIVSQVEQAIAHALNFQSKLPADTLPLTGKAMSGKRERHLLNNLAASFTPYVEVGCFHGSTLLAAAYRNTGLIVGVDNFASGANNRQTLLQNLMTYGEARASLIDASCWSVPLTGFRCCFWDGPHSKEDQKNALVALRHWYADTFVYVVDDWQRPEVSEGTMEGITTAGLKIEFQKELTSPGDPASFASGVGNSDWWWCSLGVFVLTQV